MPAPPEVVFSTATDPARAAWLPDELRDTSADRDAHGDAGELSARWRDRAWLRVWPEPTGGARVELELRDDGDHAADAAERALADLERAVTDNLTAG